MPGRWLPSVYIFPTMCDSFMASLAANSVRMHVVALVVGMRAKRVLRSLIPLLCALAIGKGKVRHCGGAVVAMNEELHSPRKHVVLSGTPAVEIINDVCTKKNSSVVVTWPQHAVSILLPLQRY